MTTLSQNQSNFLNKKLSKIQNIKKSFHAHIDYEKWVVSGRDKLPKKPDGSYASIANHATWNKLSKIEPLLCVEGGSLPTIAVYDNLCCIDLDNAIADGSLSPLAREVLATLDSYTEISRSGTGLHIFFEATKPGSGCRKNGLEWYGGENRHFITVTGSIWENRSELKQIPQHVVDAFYSKCFPDKPEEQPNDSRKKSPPLSNPDILTLLNNATNKQKFSKLFYEGNISAYGNDDSSADLALISLICFYTQSSTQIFEIFKESALYTRPERQEKWARPDYRERTIEKALNSCKEFYHPPKTESPTKTVEYTWDNPAPLQFDEEEDLDVPFPLWAFPRLMQDAILEVGRAVQVDTAMAAIPALGIAALQIGKKIAVVEKEGLLHHPSLFLVCCMDMVERKSETFKRILDPLRDIVEKEVAAHEQAKAAVKAHNDAVDEQIAATKYLIRTKTAGKASGKEGLTELSIGDLTKRIETLILSRKELPAPPKNWGDDITPPRLQQNLHIHGGAYGLFSSEGRTIFHRILDKNDTEGAVGKSIYTAATWGDDLDRSRVGSGETGKAEETAVRKPALTIVTFIQKDIWEEFCRDKTMRLSGTISRVCVANPPSRAGTRLEEENEEPFKPERIAPFIAVVDKLRKWRPQQTSLLYLSKGGAKERREFYNNLEKEMGPGGLYEDVKDLTGRAASIATRIACIFASFEFAEKNSLDEYLPEITADQFLRAQVVEEYFLAQGIDFQRAHQGPKDNHLSRVANWCKKQVQKAECKFLISTLKNRVRGINERCDDIIADFERCGWIRKAEKAKGKSFFYEINKKAFSIK